MFSIHIINEKMKLYVAKKKQNDNFSVNENVKNEVQSVSIQVLKIQSSILHILVFFIITFFYIALI